ncbi:MAG: CvpA family protein [Clostridia bacterium]|nr:CvpA family protein [Clostridia bacterium]
MNYIWDGILILAAILCIVFSMKKGFISASKSILALILTAVLFSSMQPQVLGILQSTAASDGIRNAVSKNISSAYQKKQLPEDADTTDTQNAEQICTSLGFPSFMENSIRKTVSGMTEIKNNVMEVITDAVTLMILKVIAMLLVFLLVRIFVFLLLKILESLFELPGLKMINKTLGAVLGVINALLLIYIICGAVSLFAPAEKLTLIEETVKSTYLLKYFYENNLLMSLFI